MPSPYSGLFSILPRVVGVFLGLLDRNISNIESIENTYRLKRKVSITTIFPLVLLVVSLITFGLHQYLGVAAIVIILILDLIYAVVIRILFSKDFVGGSVDRYFFPILLSLIIISNLCIADIVPMLFKSFSFDALFGLLLAGFLSYIMYYALFKIVDEFISDLVNRKMSNYKLTIELVGGERLDVRLLSINQRGDYIVQVRNNHSLRNAEVLINRHEIQKIIYVMVDDTKGTN